MTKPKLTGVTDDELMSLFENWAKSHGRAVIDGDVPAASRSYWQLDAVDKELRARGDQVRAQLLRFLDHPDLPVRYFAANWLFALAPARARSIIEDVKAGPFVPLALDAGMTLRMLDDGTFKPT